MKNKLFSLALAAMFCVPMAASAANPAAMAKGRYPCGCLEAELHIALNKPGIGVKLPKCRDPISGRTMKNRKAIFDCRKGKTFVWVPIKEFTINPNMAETMSEILSQDLFQHSLEHYYVVLSVFIGRKKITDKLFLGEDTLRKPLGTIVSESKLARYKNFHISATLMEFHDHDHDIFYLMVPQ